jgi:uncharacterized protein with GYD domain
MTHYLMQVSYNAAGVKAMVEHPQNREDAARKGIESLGGKLHAFYFAFGAYDLALICELPDNASAAAVAMTVGASGLFSKFETTVLMTTAESMAAMNKAKSVSYTPPR